MDADIFRRCIAQISNEVLEALRERGLIRVRAANAESAHRDIATVLNELANQIEAADRRAGRRAPRIERVHESLWGALCRSGSVEVSDTATLELLAKTVSPLLLPYLLLRAGRATA